MIVPEYWAGSSQTVNQNGRSILLRRWGWSDSSQAEAQAMADARLQAAVERFRLDPAGLRREPKVPYNGAAGVPIREEILARHGDSVITRNSYGAQCLNTPSVLFLDIDQREGSGVGWWLGIAAAWLVVAVLVGLWKESLLLALVIFLVGSIVTGGVVSRLRVMRSERQGGFEGEFRRRLAAFLAARPDWHVRLYRTPNGFRGLVMHRTFQPAETEVTECFRELGVDPVYARMCVNQNCFRARVSPKPWRMGISDHLRPRPGVWPVDERSLPFRKAWVEAYERAADRFSACRFLESLGSAKVHPDAREVQRLHDELCQAESGLPLA